MKDILKDIFQNKVNFFDVQGVSCFSSSKNITIEEEIVLEMYFPNIIINEV